MNKSIVSILLLSFLISVASVLAFENSTEKTLVIFSAKWCKFCQMAKQDIEEDIQLSEAIKSYTIVDVDFDVDKDLVNGYNIKSIPAFVTFQGGKETGRLVGYKSKKHLLNFLK